MRRLRTPSALGAMVALATAPFGALPPVAPGTLHAQAAVAPSPRGWIGVSFEVQTSGDGSGVRTVAFVTDVLDGSPAADGGLRPGDVLVSINGRPWTSEIGTMTRGLRPGDPVTLVVVRGGRSQEIRLRAGSRPAQPMVEPAWVLALRADSTAERIYKAMDSLRIRITSDHDVRIHLTEVDAVRDSVLRAMERARGQVVRLRASEEIHTQRPDGRPPFTAFFRRAAGDSLGGDPDRARPFPRLPPEAPEVQVGVFRPLSVYALGENRAAGAEVVELRPELGEYFQVDGGVLVVDVTPGTPAQRAGIQPGDVLTHVGGNAVASIAQLRRGLSGDGGEVPITLVRKGRRLQVVLER